MSFTKQEAIDRLKESWKWENHPSHCDFVDYHFPTEDTEKPNYDGVVFIKCWNCEVQDHFLYKNEKKCPCCDSAPGEASSSLAPNQYICVADCPVVSYKDE